MKITRSVKWFIIPSCLIMAVALLFILFGSGFNFGVDFTGGVLLTLELKADVDTDLVRSVAEGAGAEGVSVSVTGDAGTQTQALVRMKDPNDVDAETAMRNAIEEGLQETYPEAFIAFSDRVGAVAGRDLFINAVTAVLIASVLMLAYIWVRFELQSGVMAVVTLLHDVFIMIAFMAIFNFQINSPFIAAMLTVVGYSINNTIVIFDRIRENTRKMGTRNSTYTEITDASISQSLTRSINTSITTLVTIVILYLIGVTAIREFAVPIIIGLLGGFYSSIFLAGPLWALWMEARAKKEEENKASRRSSGKKMAQKKR